MRKPAASPAAVGVYRMGGGRRRHSVGRAPGGGESPDAGASGRVAGAAADAADRLDAASGGEDATPPGEVVAGGATESAGIEELPRTTAAAEVLEREAESNRELPQVDPETEASAGQTARAAADHGGPAAHSTHVKSGAAALTLGALGVVFGDIGTSPLYALKECVRRTRRRAAHDNVLGVLSLIFWALMIVVTFKYVASIMRRRQRRRGRDPRAARARAAGAPARRRACKFGLVALGIFGAALFYGDGMITPAISVLSAVEGLEGGGAVARAPSCSRSRSPSSPSSSSPSAAAPAAVGAALRSRDGALVPLDRRPRPPRDRQGAEHRPHPLAVVRGSSSSPASRAPPSSPSARSSSPSPVPRRSTRTWATSAARPIRAPGSCSCCPALVLKYFGQGALVLRDPAAVANPFFALVPRALPDPDGRPRDVRRR